MISSRDPDGMTPAERRAEVALLLAASYLRRLVDRQKALEVPAEVEALCVPPVDGQETVARKEPA